MATLVEIPGQFRENQSYSGTIWAKKQIFGTLPGHMVMNSGCPRYSGTFGNYGYRWLLCGSLPHGPAWWDVRTYSDCSAGLRGDVHEVRARVCGDRLLPLVARSDLLTVISRESVQHLTILEVHLISNYKQEREREREKERGEGKE